MAFTTAQLSQPGNEEERFLRDFTQAANQASTAMQGPPDPVLRREVAAHVLGRHVFRRFLAEALGPADGQGAPGPSPPAGPETALGWAAAEHLQIPGESDTASGPCENLTPLCEPHPAEEQFAWPAAAREPVVTFLQRHRFCPDEAAPAGGAVGPGVLAAAHERMRAGRHDDGVFYTPGGEVRFMCREALRARLAAHLGWPDDDRRLLELLHGEWGNGGVGEWESGRVGAGASPALPFPHSPILPFSHSLFSAIAGLRVCDPAVGCGALLMGMAQELLRLLETLGGLLPEPACAALAAAGLPDPRSAAGLRRHIATCCLFGCDVDGAAALVTRRRLALFAAADAGAARRSGFAPECQLQLPESPSAGASAGESGRGSGDASRDAPCMPCAVNDVSDTPCLPCAANDAPGTPEAGWQPAGQTRQAERVHDWEAVVAALSEHIRTGDLLRDGVESLGVGVAALGGLFASEVGSEAGFGATDGAGLRVGQSACGAALSAGAADGAGPGAGSGSEEPFEPTSPAVQGRPPRGRCEDRESKIENRKFDVVLSNPPYVRQELLEPQYKECALRVCRDLLPDLPRLDGKSDLYAYFYLLGLGLLREGGALCVISSNSWLDVGFGAGLQAALLRHSRILSLVESASRMSFDDALVNPAIALFRRSAAPAERAGAARFVRLTGELGEECTPALAADIAGAAAFTATPAYRVVPVPQQALDAAARAGQGGNWGGWYLRAPDLFHHILQQCGDRLCRLDRLAALRFGIKTGANDFFYLEEIRGGAGRPGEDVVPCRGGAGQEFLIEARFLRPALRTPRDLSAPELSPQMTTDLLFTCAIARGDLAGTAALRYIEWGERERDVPARPSVAGRPFWYSVPLIAPPPVLTPLIAFERACAATNPRGILCDANLVGCYPCQAGHTIPLAACLASSLGTLMREMAGIANLGQGALKMNPAYLSRLLVPDLRAASPDDLARLERAFAAVRGRPFPSLSAGEPDAAWREVDDAAIGLLGPGAPAAAEVRAVARQRVGERLAKAGGRKQRQSAVTSKQ